MPERLNFVCKGSKRIGVPVDAPDELLNLVLSIPFAHPIGAMVIDLASGDTLSSSWGENGPSVDLASVTDGIFFCYFEVAQSVCVGKQSASISVDNSGVIAVISLDLSLLDDGESFALFRSAIQKYAAGRFTEYVLGFGPELDLPEDLTVEQAHATLSNDARCWELNGYKKYEMRKAAFLRNLSV